VIDEEKDDYHLKQINEQAIQFGLKDSTPLKLKTLINFWAIKNWIKKHFHGGSKYHVQINLKVPKTELTSKIQKDMSCVDDNRIPVSKINWPEDR
jgi:ATP-dependent DNA helicase RecQ